MGFMKSTGRLPFLLLAILVPANCLLLISEDTWQTDSEFSIAVLSSEHWLRILHDFNPSLKRCQHPRRILRYQCSQLDKNFKEALLDGVTNRSLLYCQQSSMTFSLTRTYTSYNSFIFKLVSKSRQRSAFAFDSLILQMAEGCSFDDVVSRHLCVYTFDSLLLVTHPSAVKKLTEVFQTSPDRFLTVELFSQGLVSGIQFVPEFLRPLINLGIVLYSGYCPNFQMENSVIFSNYLPKLDSWNQNLLKYAQIDLNSGVLYFHGRSVAQRTRERMMLSRGGSKDSSACSILCLTGYEGAYEKRHLIGRLQNMRLGQVTSRSEASERPRCHLVGSESIRNWTLVSGIVNAQLVCPIICDGASSFEFHRNNRRIAFTLNENSEQRNWLKLSHGMRIASGGHILELPKHLTPLHHAGVYRCSAGEISAEFRVHVIIVPRWTSAPPRTVFVTDGDQLTLNCNIGYAVPEPIKVRITSGLLKTSNFEHHSFSELSKNYTTPRVDALRGETNSHLSKTLQAGKFNHYLNVQAANIQIFACTAEISDSSDTSSTGWLGFPSYKTSTETLLVRVPRPSSESVSMTVTEYCSWRHLCLKSSRLDLEFRLSPSMSHSLTKAGVRVTVEAVLNGLALTTAVINNRGWETAFQLDSGPNQSKLVLSVDLVAMTKLSQLITHLEKQSSGTISALFKYHYAKSVVGLSHVTYPSKSMQDGFTCSDDSLCFYSTAFNSSESLAMPAFAVATILSSIGNAKFIWRLVTLICCVLITAISLFVLLRQRKRNCRKARLLVVQNVTQGEFAYVAGSHPSEPNVLTDFDVASTRSTRAQLDDQDRYNAPLHIGGDAAPTLPSALRQFGCDARPLQIDQEEIYDAIYSVS